MRQSCVYHPSQCCRKLLLGFRLTDQTNSWDHSDRYHGSRLKSLGEGMWASSPLPRESLA